MKTQAVSGGDGISALEEKIALAYDDMNIIYWRRKYTATRESE